MSANTIKNLAFQTSDQTIGYPDSTSVNPVYPAAGINALEYGDGLGHFISGEEVVKIKEYNEATNVSISDLKADDVVLDGRITQEVTDRQNADLAEASERQAADSLIRDSVNAEATAREDGDQQNAEDIATEKTERENADTALQNSISAEASARAAADTALGERIDAIIGDEGDFVRYDDDGNITFPAGLALRAQQADGTKNDVLKTDSNGNAILGTVTHEINTYASRRPRATIGAAASQDYVLEGDLAAYYDKTAIDEQMAYKADLIGGLVPAAQIPPEFKTNFWSVPTPADLITLTTATQGDIALITSTTDPDYGREYTLSTNDPTVAANWVKLGGEGGGGGTAGVLSWANKTGVVVPVMSDISDAASILGDKANASDLAAYAPLDSPALVGTPTSRTPSAAATGKEIINAEWANTKLTSNLGSTAPEMDGEASAGVATTVARSDHKHPSDTSRIAVTALGTAAPAMDGIANAGTSTNVSREDHRHPSDTSRIAVADLSTVDPLADGTPSAGTSAKVAREDHVHPDAFFDFSSFTIVENGSDFFPKNVPISSPTQGRDYIAQENGLVVIRFTIPANQIPIPDVFVIYIMVDGTQLYQFEPPMVRNGGGSISFMYDVPIKKGSRIAISLRDNNTSLVNLQYSLAIVYFVPFK